MEPEGPLPDGMEPEGPLPDGMEKTSENKSSRKEKKLLIIFFSKPVISRTLELFEFEVFL
jgi:hypothetical protein